MLQAELKAKWIEALRSGKYRQAKGALNKPQGYCCLGVLCDVIDPTKWKHDKADSSYAPVPYDFGEAGEDDASLPLSVLNDLGFDSYEEDSLVSMNDEEGLSFNEIADWIEKNL